MVVAVFAVNYGTLTCGQKKTDPMRPVLKVVLWQGGYGAGLQRAHFAQAVAGQLDAFAHRAVG